MPLTINRKNVLLNERVLFKEKQVVSLGGAFPITIRANSTANPRVGLSGVGNSFDLLIDGMTTSNFDQVSAGSGTYNGESFEYLIHAIFVGVLGADKVYEVSITVYAV